MTSIILIGLGLFSKISARLAIGKEGYYWKNFFVISTDRPISGGIYSMIDNPMYGLGYLHALGIALLLRSYLGCIIFFFDWIVVWNLFLSIEKPFHKIWSQKYKLKPIDTHIY